MGEQANDKNSESRCNTDSSQFSITTKSDARAIIRMFLSHMTYTELLDTLNNLPASEEREWLLNLIFDEMEYLGERTHN
ncbi:MAG: hypothetical protein KJ979_09805 [Gammaproteobacteria bacterium]|nr:hypothetical protein [Gammaproteobacteria bacterium]MBU1530471.1 hypothetical protein [Gammaproteobacteria bacterium]MBU2088061.1 hypothetical protein [Gammaproteobacteria bacterium]MBU2129749.1 hypothetical protein [Gammaproteobacteria bacterium]MBU2210281.1 hypothetical protein [Gammaproteobacteria bacterium]